MIFLGCAGWAYNHWRGPFYPSNVTSELEFYSQYSLLNEINTTFYRIPTETMVRRWFYYTPDDFIFSAKLTRDITHSRTRRIKPDLIKLFYTRLKQGLENKFKLTLVQFPPWLKYEEKSFEFLSTILNECRKYFDGGLIVEIRDESWINLEFKDPITPAEVTEILKMAPGVSIIDDRENNRFPMPIDATGKDDCFVGRIRQDESIPDNRGINIWVAGDQLRKGAALNAVQIAEKLL